MVRLLSITKAGLLSSCRTEFVSWPFHYSTGRGWLRKALWGTNENGENAKLELKADKENRDIGCSKAVLFPMVHLSSASLISWGEKLQCTGSCLDCSTSSMRLVDSGSQVGKELAAMKGKDNSLASKWFEFFSPMPPLHSQMASRFQCGNEVFIFAHYRKFLLWQKWAYHYKLSSGLKNILAGVYGQMFIKFAVIKKPLWW